MIKLGIIDDHQIVIDGLKKLLKDSEIDVIYSATDPLEAEQSSWLKEIDVLLLDIEMPHKNGFELAKNLLNNYPDLKILMLTMYNELSLVEKAQKIGISGYLSKNIDQDKLINSIQRVHQSDAFVSQYAHEKGTKSDVNVTKNKELIEKLSDREKEILELIVQGLNNHEIGAKLFVSHRTVDTHRTNIMRKLNVSNVVYLVRIALKSGLYT
jgi:two-component system response regulator NreC